MHWLPLVAMVIASALLLLRCPLPRLVVANMEPGSKIRTSSSVEYDSNFNNSHKDLNSSANNTERSPHRTAGANNGKGNPLASFLYKDPLLKRKQSQETLAAGGHSASTGDLMDLRVQGLKSQARKTFKKNSQVPVDYKEQSGQFQVSGDFEGTGTRGRKTLLKNREGDRNRGRKALVKDRDNGDNLMGNQQLPDLLPSKGAHSETGKETLMPVEGLDLSFDEALQEDEELLMLASHPRVLFTSSPAPPKHPPVQLLLESGLLPDEEDEEEEHSMQLETTSSPSQARQGGETYRDLLLGLSPSARPSPVFSSQNPRKAARQRRQVGLEGRERAACESVSMWVTDRKTATDFKTRNVTVISAFETKKGNRIQQIFYETRCRGSKSKVPSGEHGVAGGDCLGVDKKHWVSECRTKQTYVRAFTSDSNGRMFWNWIRIDSSCVCVLQTKNHKNQWQGQGIR